MHDNRSYLPPTDSATWGSAPPTNYLVWWLNEPPRLAPRSAVSTPNFFFLGRHPSNLKRRRHLTLERTAVFLFPLFISFLFISIVGYPRSSASFLPYFLDEHLNYLSINPSNPWLPWKFNPSTSAAYQNSNQSRGRSKWNRSFGFPPFVGPLYPSVPGKQCGIPSFDPYTTRD